MRYLQFKKLLEYPNIRHCYTLKSLNLKGTSGEKQESIEKICNELNLDKNKFILSDQDHTKNITIINNGNENLDNIDGLVTDKKGFILASKSADCTTLLMYDPEKNVINKMVENYGSNPKNIICCICPSIRKCHFEVDEDVKDVFEKTFEYEGIIEKGRKIENKQKYYIDTTKINTQLLKKSGLKEENIIDCGLCTVCNNDKFHSYRLDKPKYGLNVGIISLL